MTRAVEAWNSEGVETLLAFYTEDVIWFPFPDSPDSADGFRGHDGIRELMAGWSDSFEEFTVVTAEIRDCGERVVWLGELSGRISGSGMPVRQPMGSVAWDFRDGKIGRARFYPSWEEALAVAGLSPDNEAVVRTLYDAFNSGDWDQALGLMGPDIEWETDPRHPRAGVYRGPDAVRRFVEDLETPFEATVYEPERIFSAGDHVVVFVTIRRRPAGSSAEVEVQIGELWTLRDGVIVRGQGFGQREKALAAVGLSHLLDAENA
ncbi:MAG: nuclear transport factor 2 family protein [Thermoleophilaceae bacterium]|nr:nuclear transport factor 2 family protein [Thermoleophilaceae bacterium]